MWLDAHPIVNIRGSSESPGLTSCHDLLTWSPAGLSDSGLLLGAHLGVRRHGQGSSLFLTLDVNQMSLSRCIPDL